jgi:hypothetical protein
MSLVNQTKVSISAKKAWTFTFDHLAQSVIQADALNQRSVRDLKLAVRSNRSYNLLFNPKEESNA